MEGEFQDWELLDHSADTAPLHSHPDEAIGDSEGMIRFDHFSIDSHTVAVADASLEGSAESDNPSLVDPGSENMDFGELWSDSGIDRSGEGEFGGFDDKNELGLVENVEMKIGGADLDVKGELGLVRNEKCDAGYDGFGEILSKDEDLGRLWSDSGGDALDSMRLGHVLRQGGDGSGNSGGLEGGNGSNMESREGEERSGNESEDGAIVGEKRRVVWWKVPIELLKYCAFRVSPVWSFSMAAALMGFIILGRRLSRMKRKTHSLQLKVAVDEKKMSLFRSQAARLNEAFWVVRRVPFIRPSHPASGVTSWPMMSLR